MYLNECKFIESRIRTNKNKYIHIQNAEQSAEDEEKHNNRHAIINQRFMCTPLWAGFSV